MIAEPHTPPGFSRLGCRRSIVRIFGMGTRRRLLRSTVQRHTTTDAPRAVPSIYENASVMRKSDCAVNPLEIGFPATYQVAGRVFTRPGRRRSGCAGSPRPVARCRFWPPWLFSVFIDLFGTDALGWAGSALSSRPALRECSLCALRAVLGVRLSTSSTASRGSGRPACSGKGQCVKAPLPPCLDYAESETDGP